MLDRNCLNSDFLPHSAEVQHRILIMSDLRSSATQGKSLRKKDGNMDDPDSGPPADAVQDKNALIYAKLKQIYRAAVLPVEKRYRYDYFYESPFMSDVEFDGELHSVWVQVIG